MKRIFIDLHIIQTVPPSCINRDDTGSPKTSVYGGTTRARVSSQAWKHAMRGMFAESLDKSLVGQRTLKIADMVADCISERNSTLDAPALAKKALELAGVAFSKKKESDAAALFFMSFAQADAIAEIVVANDGKISDKEVVAQLKNALKNAPSADMALFGRMVASDPSLNYDACAQVAHSISTHTVHNEYDYFTAVDDRAPEDNAGAGHLGTIEFNSSTLYRYATINAHDLFSHLKGETTEVVRSFIRAFVSSMPTGKQNTFANRTAPDLLYVTVRTDQPLNLAGAFECPVQSKNGYVAQSCERLAQYAEKSYGSFVDSPVAEWTVGAAVKGLDEPVSLNQLLDELAAWLDEHLSEGSIQ